MASSVDNGTEIIASDHIILIGVNDYSLVMNLTEILEDHGFYVRDASDWSALTYCLRLTAYDLLIVETHLEQADLMHRFAELRTLTNTPVIFLANNTAESERILALEDGAIDVLLEPVPGRELVARIRAHLQRTASSMRPPNTSWAV